MLNSSTAYQLLIFLMYIFFGMVVSLFYHIVVSIFSMLPIKHKKFATIIADTVAGLSITAFLWYVNFRYNDGQFRLYILLGLIIGVILYVKILKSLVDKGANSLYNLFTKRKKGVCDEKKNLHQ